MDIYYDTGSIKIKIHDAMPEDQKYEILDICCKTGDIRLFNVLVDTCESKLNITCANLLDAVKTNNYRFMKRLKKYSRVHMKYVYNGGELILESLKFEDMTMYYQVCECRKNIDYMAVIDTVKPSHVRYLTHNLMFRVAKNWEPSSKLRLYKILSNGNPYVIEEILKSHLQRGGSIDGAENFVIGAMCYVCKSHENCIHKRQTIELLHDDQLLSGTN